jgi:tetratricopeptide (TPR) repeat protein
MTASVVGDEFRYDLLAETLDIPSSDLATAMHELIQSEFIKETELFPVAKYSFRHPLTHEVAYESQLAPARAQIHARIADAMQVIDVDRLEENAAIVAQHFEAAGDPMNSALWHARAAAWAMTTDPAAAYESWWRVKRASQKAIDAGFDADELYAAAIWMLIVSGWRHGIAESIMRPLFEEACEIAERTNDDVYLSRICGSYASSAAFANGDFPEAERLGAKAKALTVNSEDPIARLGGLMAHPFPAVNVAKYAESVRGCDEVIEEAKDDPERGTFMIGMSPLAFHLACRGVALTELGRCAEARESQAAARALAEQHTKVTQTWTFIYDAWAFMTGRDAVTTDFLRYAEDAVALSEEVGDVFTRSNTFICAGGAFLLSGDLPRALELFDATMEFFDGTVAIRNTEVFLDMLRGDALCQLGDVETGLAQSLRAVERADAYGYAVLENLVRFPYAENLIGRGGVADLAEATRQLRDSERLLLKSESKIDWVGLHRVKSQLFAAQGDIERSESERATAIALAREMDARGYLARLGEPVPVG